VVRGGRAIIWISQSFPESILEVEEPFVQTYLDLEYASLKHLRDTIGHELIHTIQEAVHFKKDNNLLVDYDEAEAEELGRRLARGESVANHPLIRYFLDHCCEDTPQ
jgi:hypothetical protein